MNPRDFYNAVRQHGYVIKSYLADVLGRGQKSGIQSETIPSISPSTNPAASLENLADSGVPADYYKRDIAQPEGDAIIPQSIRTEDRPNLQKLLDALKAPYLHVIVSPDDNGNDYTEINVSVRARELPIGFDLQKYMSEQPLVEELELETLLGLFSQSGAVPLMAATHHVFGALKKLAESDSYNTQMSRGRQAPFNYAQGHTNLRIGSTKFNVFYSEDSRGDLEREEAIEIMPDVWIQRGEQFPR